MLRTGAPKVLLLFIKWLKQNNKGVHVSVLALNGGALELDFRNNSDVFFDGIRSSNSNFLNKIKGDLGISKGVLVKEIAKNNYDVIYANTIVSLPIAISLGKLINTSKILLHLHELNTVIQSKLPDFKNYIHGIDKIIAVSNLTANNLVVNYNVPKNKIKVIYEFSDDKKKLPDKNPSKTFTVGGSGWVYWRKGPDLFLQVAFLINKKYPDANIKFVWVGSLQGDEKIMIESDIQKCGLHSCVSFIGEQLDPNLYFNDFDVFIMTSREDPFPLVCIEVANLKKPIICFEGVTGTAEILTKGGGHVVPYMDIESMTEKIMNYYFNRKLLSQDGETAKRLFSKFDAQTICPLILNEILHLN